MRRSRGTRRLYRLPNHISKTPHLLSTLAHPKRLDLHVRVAVLGVHKPPSHISKTVLASVHVGPPNLIKSRTFTLTVRLAL